MSNDLSKALKRKTDAQLRLIEQDSAPIVRETVSGDVYAVSPTEYMQTIAAGTNITITTAGNVKTISAAMNLLGGAGITISEPDANGQVTVSGTVSDTTILGKTVEVADFTGKDGYVLTYDETAGKFVLSEQSGALPQATETVLGGVKAKAKTTETAEVAIDASTGKLFAPAPDEAANGIPAGGTAGQILSKVDGTDYNAQWVNAPSGGGGGIEVYAIFGGSANSSGRTERAFGQHFTPLTDMTIEGGYFNTDWTNGVIFTARLYTSAGTLLTSETVTGDGSTNTRKLITFATPQSISKLTSYCIVLEIPSGTINKYYGPNYPQAFLLLTQSFSGTISAQNSAADSYGAGLKFTLG